MGQQHQPCPLLQRRGGHPHRQAVTPGPPAVTPHRQPLPPGRFQRTPPRPRHAPPGPAPAHAPDEQPPEAPPHPYPPSPTQRDARQARAAPPRPLGPLIPAGQVTAALTVLPAAAVAAAGPCSTRESAASSILRMERGGAAVPSAGPRPRVSFSHRPGCDRQPPARPPARRPTDTLPEVPALATPTGTRCRAAGRPTPFPACLPRGAHARGSAAAGKKKKNLKD